MTPETILALSKAIQTAEIAKAKAEIPRDSVLMVDTVVRVRGTVKVGKDGTSSAPIGGIDPWKVIGDLLDRVRIDDLPALFNDPRPSQLAMERIACAQETVKKTYPVQIVPRAGSLRAQVTIEEIHGK